MGLQDMLERIQRAIAPRHEPYLRPDDLEQVKQDQSWQRDEIDRLRQIAEDEDRVRRLRRGR